MATVADTMHFDGKVLLRPEFGLLGPRWPVIACRTLTILKSIHALYRRGRDIIISTGIIDDHTPPEYRSVLLAAVTIESKQVGETRKYIHPANYQKHIALWGREQWPHCSPILCAYHLPLIDAHDIIPDAYRQLGVLGEGRLRGGALLVEGAERARIMALPVKRVKIKYSPDVVAFQEELKRRGVETFSCPELPT
jgi:hypothetical protein